MARGTGEPTPGRRPLSVGTGNTGNPCEYPGCTDKNASLSTLWGRPDQDHDFGDPSRALRCQEHWGLEAPRAPRQDEAPLSGRRKSETSPTTGPSGKARKHKPRWSAERKLEQKRERKKRKEWEEALAQKKVINLGELDWLSGQAGLALLKDPNLALNIGTRALEEEQRLAARVGEPRATALMDEFRRVRGKAQKSLLGRRR